MDWIVEPTSPYSPLGEQVNRFVQHTSWTLQLVLWTKGRGRVQRHHHKKKCKIVFDQAPTVVHIICKHHFDRW